MGATLPAAASEVTLHHAHLVRLAPGVALAAGLALPAEDRSLPVVDEAARDDAAMLLLRLDQEGRAQGFAGILYDNRDRGHSRLHPRSFPRLAQLRYGFELMAEQADYGLAGGILLPAAVFGNSSTAVTAGPAPRSLVRLAMTSPGLPELQARLYLSDHLYVYPEHRDHDEVDLFPANWPYTLTSQGSSGSDRQFLEAIAMTLAAFPPQTFARLRQDRLVAPTLQMILRSSLATVATREDYLSGAAHPAVFDGNLLDPERMVAAAAALQPEDIPPLVRITVTEEDFRRSAGLASLDERLFDTPSAVARIWRDFAWEREMTVEATATGPDEPPVRFSWHLLRGDPNLVEIVPLDAEGRRARLRLRWHDAFEAGGAGDVRRTSRIDVGVFATRGGADSAPAIISVSFPTHQLRSYGPSEDGSIELQSVDYDALARDAAFDPLLHWSAPWVDIPVRDASGAIVGWRRAVRDGTETFVPHDAVESLRRYRIDRTQPGRPVLKETGADPP
jgi:hypothetical protein